jgi:ribosomal protein S18 acetylase RimI-like enzyme
VPEDFFIRKANTEDASAVLHCLAMAFAPYRARYTAAAWEDTVLTPDLLQQRMSSMNVLVAVSPQAGIAGTIALALMDNREGHLRGMAVLPGWQGTGVAEALLLAAESELAILGPQRITLDTTEPLERAMRFYEKHGYRRSGKITDFFGMPLYEYIKELAPQHDR